MSDESPMQTVLKKLQENPQDKALRLNREILQGAITQYVNLHNKHEQLKAYTTRIRVGPILLNNVMKLVGGGFA